LKFTAPRTGVTAAVVGVIASLAVFFLVHIAWQPGHANGPPLGLALAQS
jgi:chromate transporter